MSQTFPPDGPKKKRRGLLLLVLAGLGGTVFLCVMVLVLASLGDSGDATPTPARAIAQAAATEAATATEEPEPSATLRPTSTPRPTNTPKPSATPAPTRTPLPSDTPVPTAEPSPTPDKAAEARAFYAAILAVLAPGDAASARVQAQVEAIAAGESVDVVTLYRLADDAAETWEQIMHDVYSVDAPAGALRDARDSFALCASDRQDAFVALMSFLDTRNTSDQATYMERIEDSNAQMLRGIVGIMTYAPEIAGELDATPTPDD